MQEANETNQENLADSVMDSLGVADDSASNVESVEEKSSANKADGDLPDYVKARLGRMQKRHNSEVRALRDEMDLLKQHLMSPSQSNAPVNPYTNEPIAPGSEEDRIHRAVKMALTHQEQERQKALQAQQTQKLHKHYQSFQQELDNASNRYEDFDDVVRADDAPFTNVMRDYAMTLPNGADVLYKIGQNRDELQRIAQLHPVEQAREMAALSHALVMEKGSSKQSNNSRVMGDVKTNPVNSQSVNDKTSVSELRKRLKSNHWS